MIKITRNADTLTIHVCDMWDVHSKKEFLATYEPIDKSITRYVVDLCDCNHIDSAAIGMLIVLKDEVGDFAEIEVVNIREAVLNILKCAHVEKIVHLG